MEVHKTFKMFVGGAFPRSESGRTFVPPAHPGINVPLASRKDLRDAVTAAHRGQVAWWGRDAYNRGQILFRCAEMLEGRKDSFVTLLAACGRSASQARREVEQSLEIAVWYAGCADKVQQLLGSRNAVAGPYSNFSETVPTGVVVCAAPDMPALLGPLALLLPVLVGGNAAVTLLGAAHPQVGLALGEVFATSDVPAGAVNLLSGRCSELLLEAAQHRDVDGLLAAGAPDREVGRAAAEAVQRVRWADLSARAWRQPEALVGVQWIEPFVEVRTLWHPVAP